VTRARAALLLTTLACVWMSDLTSGSWAQGSNPRMGHPYVFLYLIDHVSFEEAMQAPAFSQLARGGGVALMTAHLAQGERGRAPSALFSGTLDLSPSSNLMGILTTYLLVCPAETSDGPAPPCPDAAGSFIASAPKAHSASLFVLDATALFPPDAPRSAVVATVQAVAEDAVQALSSESNARVIVASLLPSSEMDREGDEVTPLLMTGPGTGADPGAAIGSLSSDSARQKGLVSIFDVAPTILQFFQMSVPSEMEGNPIRVVAGGDVFALHRLHLEQRRIRIPIQMGMLAFLLAIVLLTVAASLAVRVRGLRPEASAVLRFLVLSVVALYLVTLAGGLLPRLTYAVVIPFVVVATLGLTALAVGARWPGTFGPFTFLAAASLGFVIVDATFFGGRTFRVPLIGGTMFDGARFYGLPNAFTALVLAAAVLLAVRLEPFAGFSLIFATGLMVGFPRLGADVGGSITMFAAAGLWWVLRTRARVRVRDIGIVVGVVALGLAVVLLVNRYWPGTPTHATRFVERSGDSLSSVFSTIRHRFAATFHLMSAQPEAYVPMAGLLLALWVLVARPEPFRSGLELAGPVWGTALLVIVLASLVAFVANDTGSTAAAPGLIYAGAGLAYPAFLASERKAAPT